MIVIKILRNKPLMIIIAAALIIAGIFIKGKIDTEHLKKVCTSVASGTVTAIKKSKQNSDEKVLEISYLTSGKTYTAEVTDVNKKVGDKVSIYYNPSNPEQVISKTQKDNGTSFGMYLLIGIPVVLYLLMQRMPQGGNSGGGKENSLEEKYKQRLEEIKADDDFDYGE